MPRAFESPRRWRPSAEGNERLRNGYPLSGSERGIQGRSDASRSSGGLPRVASLQTARAGALGRGSGGSPSQMTSSHSMPQLRSGPAGAMPELHHLMQAQYAALISIANAVKAVPPPPQRDPLPAIDESLRSENVELRRVASSQQAEIARLRSALQQIQGASATAAQSVSPPQRLAALRPPLTHPKAHPEAHPEAPPIARQPPPRKVGRSPGNKLSAPPSASTAGSKAQAQPASLTLTPTLTPTLILTLILTLTLTPTLVLTQT